MSNPEESAPRPSRKPEELRHDAERKRAELARNLDALEDRIRLAATLVAVLIGAGVAAAVAVKVARARGLWR